MAVKTTYELFDIVDANKDYSIKATDLDGVLQTIISSDNAVRYMTRKYGERKYTILTGGITQPDLSYGKTELNSDFRLWLVNRQHNIDKQYQALFDYNYSPIENVDRYENETVTRDISTEYGKTDTESGTDRTTYGKTDTESGTDTTTYGKTDTESGTDRTTYGKVETNSGTDTTTEGGTDSVVKDGSKTTETEKAGFNAPDTYTKSEKITEDWDNLTDATRYGHTSALQHGHALTNSGNDSVTYGKVDTLSGSDAVVYGHTNTQGGSDSVTYGHTNTQGGEDTTDDDTERTLHVHGNIGVTTNNQLIDAEIQMRMLSLAEMLIDNFINDYTYYA